MAERLMSEGSGDSPKIETPKFSLTEWLDGRSQATRSVRIYGSLHLYGERERLGHDLEVARASKNTERVTELKQQIDDLTVQMQDDYVDFDLRGLTQSKRMELVDELEASGDDNPETLTLQMLTHYIVSPPGVTADTLAALAEWDSTQAAELITAMNQLNSSVPNIGATRPF